MESQKKSCQFINDQIAESIKEWCSRNQELLSKKTDSEILIEKYKSLISRQDRMIYEQELETVAKWENRTNLNEKNDSISFRYYTSFICFVLSFLSFMGIMYLILIK